MRIDGPVNDSPESKPVSILGFSAGVELAFKEMGIVTLGDLAGWTGPLLFECGLSYEMINAIDLGLFCYRLNLSAA
jgi:hypothetical protein